MGVICKGFVRKMRRLTGSILGLALLGLGGTYAASVGLQRGVEAALAQSGSRAERVTAEGWPAKIAVRLTAPELHAPSGRLDWSGTELRASTSPLAPLSWQLELPPTQTLHLDAMRYAITGTNMEITASVGARESLPLTRATLGAQAAQIAPALAPAAALGIGDLAVELSALAPSAEHPAPPGAALYRLTATAASLTLPPEITAQIAQPGLELPSALENLVLHADLGLARPLDRHLQPGMAYATRIEITEAGLDWGGRSVALSGALNIDANGLPEGVLSLRLPDWRSWYELALRAGILPENRAPMVAAIAGQMAAQSPDGVLAVPITFAAGQMRLGPVPIGPSPRLR